MNSLSLSLFQAKAPLIIARARIRTYVRILEPAMKIAKFAASPGSEIFREVSLAEQSDASSLDEKKKEEERKKKISRWSLRSFRSGGNSQREEG